ncbi:hypothetical protein Hanom_Chr05g00388251 [Helianthus anomalus]
MLTTRLIGSYRARFIDTKDKETKKSFHFCLHSGFLLCYHVNLYKDCKFLYKD